MSIQRLGVLLNESREEQFNIVSFATSIGRLAANNYAISTDMLVSKQHIFILFLNGQFFIQDVGSKNGTLLNNHLIEPWHLYKINTGDQIIVGMTKIMFVDLSCESNMLSAVPTGELGLKSSRQTTASPVMFKSVADSVHCANQ